MGPSGSCRPQMGPMLAPWTLLSGMSSEPYTEERPNPSAFPQHPSVWGSHMLPQKQTIIYPGDFSLHWPSYYHIFINELWNQWQISLLSSTSYANKSITRPHRNDISSYTVIQRRIRITTGWLHQSQNGNSYAQTLEYDIILLIKCKYMYISIYILQKISYFLWGEHFLHINTSKHYFTIIKYQNKEIHEYSWNKLILSTVIKSLFTH